MSNGYLTRACPLCGAHAHDVEVRSGRRAEELDFDTLLSYWDGFFREKIFFSYVRCERCLLLYCRTFFNEEQLSALYSSMSPNMSLVPIDALRKTQRGYFEALERYGFQSGDYMEIGPDIGLFTENVTKVDIFGKYWLFEPNRDVLSELGRVLGHRNHIVMHDLFDFSRVPDHSVGVAVMIQVLDHLINPLETLRQIKKKMMPGGRLLIVTHDESSLLRQLIGARWPPFCLQHPQLYSHSSMTKILTAAGFSQFRIEKTTNFFPIQFLLKHLLWAAELQVPSVPRFGGASLGLKLGNTITLAAS